VRRPTFLQAHASFQCRTPFKYVERLIMAKNRCKT
jgi:hypothetical protein